MKGKALSSIASDISGTGLLILGLRLGGSVPSGVLLGVVPESFMLVGKGDILVRVVEVRGFEFLFFSRQGPV